MPTKWKLRTRAFALRIIRLVEALPKARTAEVIGKQLLRCGTSVGANYRAACRAKSQADLSQDGDGWKRKRTKHYWIELLIESGQVDKERVNNLLDESNQIVSIIVSSINTARGHHR